MGTREGLSGHWSHIVASTCGVAILAIAIALAGCGGGGGDTTAAAPKSSEEKPSSTVAETEAPVVPGPGSDVSTGLPTGVAGSVVVSEAGFTFYAFSKDQPNSGKTACYGQCEKYWLPYTTVAKPTAVVNAHASEVGTLKRKDGQKQVTYGGWPLYSHVRDGMPLSAGAHEQAGHADAKGRKSFGGVWYPINPSGELVE
jgi:predicted lipoprotein with Yx(FWY)xxD motif